MQNGMFTSALFVERHYVISNKENRLDHVFYAGLFIIKCKEAAGDTLWT